MKRVGSWCGRLRASVPATVVLVGAGVFPAVPVLADAITTSQQPGSAVVGSPIADMATVTGTTPTGTVTFDLFNNPNGLGTPLFVDTVPLVGGLASSGGITTTATGTDYWVATYNGDSNNSPVTSGLSAEPVTITPTVPNFTTIATPSIVQLGPSTVSLSDSATLSRGFNPTGTIIFKLLGPTFPPPETVTVTGNGTYILPNSIMLPTTGTVAGVYPWIVTYTGDANNETITTTETVQVFPAAPSLTTVSTGDMVGQIMTDTATLSGGYFPTGSLTFDLLDPSDTVVFIDTLGVTGNESITSAGFVPSVAGQYQWVVSYNGDPNNEAVPIPPEFVTVSGPASVPEPGTFALLGSALVALGPIRRWRRIYDHGGRRQGATA